jgi:TIR domain
VPAGELFLSHATPDRAFVERLTKRLTAKKVRYFYSKRHIAGARQWHDELGAALNRCTWFVVILSKKSVKSEWVKRELLFALQSPRYQTRILPVLLADCAYESLSWTLPSFQFVDFRSDFETEPARQRNLRQVFGDEGRGMLVVTPSFDAACALAARLAAADHGLWRARRPRRHAPCRSRSRGSP